MPVAVRVRAKCVELRVMSLLSEFSNAADIRKAIELKARGYVPEWRFQEDAPDGGAALALAFADMFGETVERLARVPYKYFLYFLNLLEIKVRSVSPATGLAHFILSDNAETGRRVPAGTQLYADVSTGGSDSTRIVFETENEITAVPSKLIGMYGVDPRYDVINLIDPQIGEARLFHADMGKNLQLHRFGIWHGDVLNIKSPARISVRLENMYSRHEGGKNTEKLADPAFATWSYVRNGASVEFSKVYVNEGAIILELEGGAPAREQIPLTPPPIEDEAHIICDIHPGRLEAGITTDGISLGSAYLHTKRGGVNIAPDFVYYNDIALKAHNPGYLFGKAPGRYDTLLISCDEVLSKRGARLNLDLVMQTVIRESGEMPQGPVYDWDGRYIIEKNDGRIVTPDNMYISEVVWEYWNDVGWANLEVESQNLNPFKSDEDIRHENISFICPDDMAGSYQNSIWGYWIRSRIISVENPYSLYGRWQLPFAESISFSYDYGSKLKSAGMLKIENNAESAVVSSGKQGAVMELYKPLKYPEHAVYLAFDKQPNGLPLSIYIGLDGTGGMGRTLSFERMIRDASGRAVFRACKALDETGGMKDSGVISLYVPGDMIKESIFGLEAYWLRMVDADLRYKESDGATVLERIEINAASIVQKQTVQGLYYSTELFESGKTITLPERPVLQCEVFVDEISVMEPDKLEDMPGVNLEYEADGGVSKAWVKWDVAPSLTGMGAEDRAVALDAQAGVLRFGNGVCGRVPPNGTRNIRVNYSYGGGALGNVPPGSIIGLVSSIPTVASATNFTSTGGGNDKENIHAIERVGPARLRHRGRAVTLDDFESLVLEEYPEIAAVRAFAGLGSDGRHAQSHVTVVLLPWDTENREHVLKICRSAYRFLSQRAHCELVTADRLAVVPALMMTISATVEAVAEDITRAAATERAILNAIAGRLGEIGARIGDLPSASDIFDCLRNIPNLTYADRISLEGQYFDGSRRILTALDSPGDFPFACARNGTHIIRF